MMTFHEDVKWAMVVMDGNRCVAKAKKTAIKNYWMLSLNGACWTDPRARENLRKDWPKDIEALWPKYPQFMVVTTKSEARKILKELAGIK